MVTIFFRRRKVIQITSFIMIIAVMLSFVCTDAFASGRTFRLPVDVCKIKPELDKCKKDEKAK